MCTSLLNRLLNPIDFMCAEIIHYDNITLFQVRNKRLPRQFHKNPRKRQPLKERRDHDRIEKREKSHERYYNEI